jgi:hypothetical protein
MSLIAELKKQAQENIVKVVFALLLLLLGVIWAAVPSETWGRVSAAVPKSVLWALLGLVVAALIAGVAYIFYLRKKAKPKERFAFGVYWDSVLNPLCPACKTPLSQSRRHLFYAIGEGIPLPKPITECLKCDKHLPLFDDYGNSVTLSDAKRQLSEGNGAI